MIKTTIGENTYSVESLYRWDLNQVLEISGLSLPVVPEVHFSDDFMKEAIVCPATMDDRGIVRADVPNVLLQKANKINAYVCVTEGEKFRTLYKIVIPVINRARPNDYAPKDEAYVYALRDAEVECIALDPTSEGVVEKVLDGDRVIFRFSIPRGYIPVKGTDYFTPTDKAEIVAAVVANFTNVSEVGL